MAGTKKVLREVWIKISEHPSDGFYPALTLLPPQSYRTDPFEKISNELPDGTIEKLYDSEAKKELLAKIRPAGGGVDDTFFEEVQLKMLVAIAIVNNRFAKEYFSATDYAEGAAMWFRHKRVEKGHLNDIAEEFRQRCRAETTFAHLERLDHNVCEMLKHLVFKQMHSVKPIFALGPTPEEVLTGRSSKLANLDGHFHDQRDITIYEQRGGAPVPSGSSQVM